MLAGRFLLAVLAVSALSAAIAAENLLPVGFEPDNAGSVLGWELRGIGMEVGEDAAEGKVLRFRGAETGFSFSHINRRLAPGEKYRLSAKVRTRSLDGPKRLELLVHSWPWDWDGVARIPRDTAGGWREVSWEGTLPASKDDRYDVVVYGSGGLPPGGLLEIADLRLEALSPKGEAAAVPIPVYAPYKARISPVDPELRKIDGRNATMQFYYPGAVADAGGRRMLRARIAGRVATAEFGDDHKARVSFGGIAGGDHVLEAEVVGADGATVFASNVYAAATLDVVPDATPGRRLNNFVTELYRRPLENGDYEFVLAGESWVHIGLDRPYANVSASIDGSGRRDIRWRPGEPSEAMRLLKAGRHVATVAGVDPAARAGTISVRLVKPIIACKFDFMSCRPSDKAPYVDSTRYYYDHEYLLTCGMYGVPNIHSVYTQSRTNLHARTQMGEIGERGSGIRYEISCGHRHPVRDDLERLARHILGSGAFRCGVGSVIDESGIAVEARKKYNSAEVLWRACASEAPLDACLEDGALSLFNRPGVDVPELSAYVNVGKGRSLVVSEAYFRSPENEADCKYTMEFMKRQIRGMRELVPSSPSHYAYLLNGWMMIGCWTSWCHPYVDMKAFNAKMLAMLATDPEFADVGGVGFSTPFCDEDFFRFAFAAIRHYCIEGRTDDFADSLGYKVFCDNLTNGDFMEGLSGWKADCAEQGSISVGHVNGLARRHQHRFFPGRVGVKRMNHGDDFALFARSAKAPNVLSQRLAGLEDGRLYQVTFATMDYDGVLSPGSVAPSRLPAFWMQVRGAEEIPELTHVMPMRNPKYSKVTTYAHRYVFRAKGASAEILFSDWQDSKTPGGRAGERQLLNYVGCRPFFVRDEAELAFLRRWTGGRDGRD